MQPLSGDELFLIILRLSLLQDLLLHFVYLVLLVDHLNVVDSRSEVVPGPVTGVDINVHRRSQDLDFVAVDHLLLVKGGDQSVHLFEIAIRVLVDHGLEDGHDTTLLLHS